MTPGRYTAHSTLTFLPVAKVLQSPSGKSQCFVAEFGHIVRYVEGAGSWHIDTTLNLTIPAGGLLIPEIREAIGYAKPEVPRKKQYSVPVRRDITDFAWAKDRLWYLSWDGQWKESLDCWWSSKELQSAVAAQAIRQAGPDGLPPDASGAVKFEDPREKPVFKGDSGDFQKQNGIVCFRYHEGAEWEKANPRSEFKRAGNLRAYDLAAAS